jgi:hypothetical protein
MENSEVKKTKTSINKQKEQEPSLLSSVANFDTKIEASTKTDKDNSDLNSVQTCDDNVDSSIKKEHEESILSNVQESQPIQIDYTSIVKLLSLDDIFINLNLISKIEVGDKLYINDKYINIDTSYVQSIVRWFYGVDRKLTINFIRLVIGKSFEFCDSLLKSDPKMLFRLTNDLKNSISGLTKLKQTYFVDKLVQAEIDVIIEDIRAKIDSTLTAH